MFYIVDKNNKIVASSDFLPSENDLASRQEHVIQHDSNYPAGSAEVVNGIVQKKPAPQPTTRDLEMAKIYSRMFKNVAKELQAENELTDPSLINYKDKTQKDKPNGPK